MTACKEPSTKKSNALLHILAKRTWREYGTHMWNEYCDLVRTSVQLAKSFPKEVGVDLRNANGLTALMSAAACGNETMAFELVRAKCDINAVHKVEGQPDRTAMDMAACARMTDILNNIKRHGGWGLCEKKPKGDGFQKKSRRK